MRVNIFEAGLVTLLLAAKGLLQLEDDAPKRPPESLYGNGGLPAVWPKPGKANPQ